MFSEITKEIREIVDTEEMFLMELDDNIVSTEYNAQNRSCKQILGHLIDSASNNTHRIVHLQYGRIPLVFPDYARNGNNDRWIAIQSYNTEDWHTLVQLFKYINLHLAHVIEHIAIDKIDNTWVAGNGEEITLRSMAESYLEHLKLHINEIRECVNNFKL